MALCISHFGVGLTSIGSDEDSSRGSTYIVLGIQTFTQDMAPPHPGAYFWILFGSYSSLGFVKVGLFGTEILANHLLQMLSATR